MLDQNEGHRLCDGPTLLTSRGKHGYFFILMDRHGRYRQDTYICMCVHVHVCMCACVHVCV